LLFKGKYKTIKKFVSFLEHDSVKKLSFDQWDQLYVLVKEYNDDMKNYDENGSWPSLFDDFYEWISKS